MQNQTNEFIPIDEAHQHEVNSDTLHPTHSEPLYYVWQSLTMLVQIDVSLSFFGLLDGSFLGCIGQHLVSRYHQILHLDPPTFQSIRFLYPADEIMKCSLNSEGRSVNS